MNDYPVAAYTVQQTKGKYEVVGTQIQAGPYGIGFDKDETQLLNASQAALKAIISDGTYTAILAKWGLQQGSLTTAEINGGGKS
jgi:polar amino acid transport system substrate-binding protein